MKYNINKSTSMHTHDTSSHEKSEDTSVTTSMRNSGGISNPGSTMPPAHHSLKHGERRYMANTIDQERLHDPIMDHDANC